MKRFGMAGGGAKERAAARREFLAVAGAFGWLGASGGAFAAAAMLADDDASVRIERDSLGRVVSMIDRSSPATTFEYDVPDVEA